MSSASEPSSRRISTGRLALAPSKRRPLQVGAELEDVLPRQRSRVRLSASTHWKLRDVALLIVEEAAALRLRRIDHRRLALRVDLDLESPDRHRGLEHDVRPNRKAIDDAGRDIRPG